MMRVFQVSDLHLVDQSLGLRKYGLRVLDEIFSKAAVHQVDALVIAGDLFDTFEDVLALKDEFVQRVDQASFDVFFLPGNHEWLRKPSGRSMDSLDWGKTRVLSSQPFQRAEITNDSGQKLEIVGIPHQESYDDLEDALSQQKWHDCPRVVVAHGTVLGWSYIGVDQEKGSGIFDPSAFQKIQPSWVALGHVHRRPPMDQRYGFPMAYAGSARVWRKGETGPRGGWLVDFGEGAPSSKFVSLESAGEFREAPIVLGPHRESLPSLEGGAQDWVHVKWSGVAKVETEVKAFEAKLKEQAKGKIRALSFDRSQLVILEDQSNHPLLVEFLERVEGRKDSFSPELLDEVRRLGLQEIVRGLEA